MRKNHQRIAALATTILCANLAAQSVPVPPTRELIDGNGVDLFRGTFTVDQTIASIGGNQGLTYRRINRGSGWTDNIEVFIQSGANTFYVTVAGRTDRFIKSGSIYTPTEANGSTLSFSSPIYTYTARDGTIVTFDKSLIESYNQFGNEGLATAIVEPNGSRVDITYRRQRYCEYFEGDLCTGGYSYAKRLSQATSANGYVVKYFYVSDELLDGSQMFEWTTVADRRLVNRAVDYCNNNQCTLTQNWPGDNNPNHLVNTFVTTSNRITGVLRPGSVSNDLTIGYDASGKVASVADHAGSTSYAYADVSGSRDVTVTNALNETSVYTFLISSERLTKYKDPLNNETNYTYDSNARLTRITKPEGNYTNTTYDARGNVTETRAVAKAGSGAADITATATFPGTCTNVKTCNSPTATTDPRGNVSNYTYDATHGGVLTVTAPAPSLGATRPQQRFTYVTQQAQIKSSTGTIVGSGINITLPATVAQCATLASCTGGADEIKSAVTYGVNGVANNLQPTQIASGNGNGTLTATTGLAYDMIGNLVTVDGPLAGTDDTTTAIYDALRRPYGIISPDTDGAGARPRLAQRSTFATNGDVTRQEIGTATGTTAADLAAMAVAQGSDMLYDADGRKLKDTLTGSGSSHAVTQYSYDAEGRWSCAAQRMNPAAWPSLPASACTLGTTGSFGPDRITKSLRDLNGRVTTVQAALGTAEQANERILAFTPNGVLAHLIDANDNRTTYERDGHDRLIKTRFPIATIGADSSSTTDYEQLTLDANGNATSRRLRDGNSVALTFDALNRVTLKDLPGAEPDVTYAYDLANRMTSANQTGHSLTFTYDALNRILTQVGPQGIVASEWDLAGRRAKLTYPGSGLFVNYDYDLLGNVTFIRENGAGSGVGVLATYQYDSLGRRASLTFGNGVVQNYDYDPVTRLASQTTDLASTANDLTQSFTYNPASQISSVTRSNDLYAWTGHFNQNDPSTANGLNQIANFGSKTISHDTKGNITAFGSDTFGYSSENLLTSGPGSTSLTYDPQMRLYQVASGTTLRLAYDGLDRIAEHDGLNALLRRYVHGPGIDDPLVWYEGSGATIRRFLSSDERGSIISLTDSAGALVGINRYDEFGIPQATNLGAFGYTGQTWLPLLKAWYYKARIYHPELRFLQPDPIGYGDSPNLYAYVLNDPVNLTDPYGLWPIFGPQVNFLNGIISAPRDIWWGANFSYRLSRGDPSAQATLNAFRAGVALLSNNKTEGGQILLQILGNNKAFLTGRALSNLAITYTLSRVGGTIGFRIGIGANVFSVGSGSLRAVDRALTQIQGAGLSTSGLADRSLARLIIAGAAGMNIRFDEASGTIYASERDPTGRIPGREVEVCKFDDSGVCQPPTKKGN